MAHVHGATANGAAQASKHVVQAAQHSTQAAHAVAQQTAHLAEAAHHHAAAGQSMAALAAKSAPAAMSFHHAATGAAATGALATASTKAGKSLMGRFFSHPLVLFGLGVAVGYAIHKYRKEIIDSASRAAEQSKDFVLQQRENLEDLVAETQEPEN